MNLEINELSRGRIRLLEPFLQREGLIKMSIYDCYNDKGHVIIERLNIFVTFYTSVSLECVAMFCE